MNTIPVMLEDTDLIILVHVVDELQQIADEEEDDYEVDLSQAVRAIIRNYKSGDMLKKEKRVQP